MVEDVTGSGVVREMIFVDVVSLISSAGELAEDGLVSMALVVVGDSGTVLVTAEVASVVVLVVVVVLVLREMSIFTPTEHCKTRHSRIRGHIHLHFDAIFGEVLQYYHKLQGHTP